MNIRKNLLTIISFTILLSACGKRTGDQELSNDVKSIQPTSGEVHFRGYQEIRQAFFDNNHKEFKSVIEKFPNIGINEMLTEGETFLTYAIKHDFIEIRNYLIDAGADLNLQNINKETPLIVAVKNNRLNSLERLIDLNVNLNSLDVDKDSALHTALKIEEDDIGVLLVKAGSKLQLMDKHGDTALKIAQVKNVPKTLELIMIMLNLEHGAPDAAEFKKLISNADHKSISMVLGRYPYLLKDSVYDSLNPFSLLIDSSNEASAIKSAEILIEYQANVNGPETSIQTPLIKAVKLNKKIFANILLSANANPHHIDQTGKSALIHAVEVNDSNLVNMLLIHSVMEKYTVRVNGKQKTFNACTTARKTAKRLKTSLEKSTNEKIRKDLDCGFWNWLF